MEGGGGWEKEGGEEGLGCKEGEVGRYSEGGRERERERETKREGERGRKGERARDREREWEGVRGVTGHTTVIPAVIINLNPRRLIRRRHDQSIADYSLESCLLRFSTPRIGNRWSIPFHRPW